jgi:hypothetical protein
MYFKYTGWANLCQRDYRYQVGMLIQHLMPICLLARDVLETIYYCTITHMKLGSTISLRCLCADKYSLHITAAGTRSGHTSSVYTLGKQCRWRVLINQRY